MGRQIAYHPFMLIFEIIRFYDVSSHDNITYMARNIVKSYNFKDQHERMVSYLPLSHIAAFIADMVMMLSCRGSTYFADKNALKGTLTQTLKEAQPTIVLCVPRVYEKI